MNTDTQKFGGVTIRTATWIKLIAVAVSSCFGVMTFVYLLHMSLDTKVDVLGRRVWERIDSIEHKVFQDVINRNTKRIERIEDRLNMSPPNAPPSDIDR